MPLYDLIFPLNLGPLTYEGPPGLSPGSLVVAEIKRALTRGIVLGPAKETPSGRIKKIRETVGEGPVLGPAMLRLVSWMSDYYFAKEGIVLKEFFPGDLLKKLSVASPALPEAAEHFIGAIDSLAKEVRREMKKGYYKTFLLHAPSTGYQMDFILGMIKGLRNVIILCPEIEDVKHLAGSMEAALDREGSRLSVIHSGLTVKKRRTETERIISGEADIVVGSRSALFAPLKDVSLIAVLNEESRTYKKEEGFSYSVRDTAVMRGYLEGSTVILSSICPSFESVYNAKNGKYTLLRPDSGQKRPNIRLIDMRGAKKISPHISKPLIDRAAYLLRKKEKVAFLINRKGYSLLECEECGHMEECQNCGVPFIYHKSEGALRCGYCGFKKDAPEKCARCGSPKLKTPGMGIEMAEEEIKSLLDAETLRLEGKKPAIELIEAGNVVVGTKLIAKRRELKGRFSLIGVLNGDSYLAAPDFRSSERAFQEMVYLSEKVAQGEIFIQTRMAGSPLFRSIKNYDFDGFYEEGMRARAELRYPPFSKTALVFGPSPDGRVPGGLEKIKLPEGVEVLGPVAGIDKRGKKIWKALVKARSGEELRKAVRSIMRVAPSASVDIDPFSF